MKKPFTQQALLISIDKPYNYISFNNSSIVKIFWWLLFSVLLFSFKVQAQGTWTAITTAAPHTNGGGMLLLSDGTVLVKTFTGGSDGYGNTYDKLTPNASGSYVNGTWSSIAPMTNTRLYYSSQVLKDGRVYVAGGEYGTGGSLGEVYDPLTNIWTNTPAPGSTISDANSEILSDGRVLQALVTGSLTGTKIYDPVTNTYSNGPTALGIHNESAWIKLPDNSILYVNRLSTSSERYIPSTNTWIADATVPIQLYDAFGDEAGGALLLPDGRAFFLGSSGHNAYYTPSGSTAPGTWAAASDFPNAQGTPDAPAAMMVNGKVLCNASPVPTSANHFPSPTTFYEFDPVANSFTAITAPGGGATLAVSTYVTNFLNLPDGTILYSRQNSNQYYVYTPSGSPVASGKPGISTVTQTGTSTYQITGTLFNGISQGATYGDDWQMNSNYPIVRLVNGSNVYYTRTSNWNSTGVKRGSAADTATFTIPSGLPNVPYSLYVVANGIASDPFSFSLTPTAFVSIAVTSGSNPSCTGASVTFTATPTNGGTTPSYQWKINGSNAGTNSPTFTTSSLTNGQIITCVMTSNLSGVLGNPATSGGITMTVNAPSAAAISIAASATTICSGTTVTFTATPTNGGTAPSYQWKINGVNAGTNSPTFATSSLTNGQVVTCDITSNSTCVTTSAATSNSITMTVNTNSTPSLSISTGSTSVCNGTQVVFTASATNGGLSPSYQWKVNGANVGNNIPQYVTSGLTNGQIVSCVIITNAACAATATLGTGVNINATTSDVGASYPTYYGNGRQQYLILASELTALGLSAGNITSVSFNINGTTGDPATLFGYTIKMAATSAAVLTSTFLTPTSTTVFGPSNYSPVLNSVNTHTFTTPFVWDGTSNVLVDICFSNQVVGTIAYQSFQTTSSFVSTAYYQADGTGGAGACSQATASGTGSIRPNMIFTDATALSATSNQITMTINAIPTVSISGTTTICNGSSTTLTASGASTYQWTGGPATAAYNVSPTTNTTYIVTGTTNGCSNTASQLVTVNPLPSISISGTTTICNGANTTLTASGGTTYQWTGGPATAAFNVSPTTNTTYTVTGTAANGCTNTSSQLVTVNALPAVSISGTTTICNGSSTTLTASGASSYQWTGGPATAAYNVSPTSNTTYTVTGTTNGCSNTASQLVTVNPLPSVAISGTTTICNGASTTLTASGGTTYQWTGGPATAAFNVSPTTNTTYTVTGTTNGCSNTASQLVTVNALPSVSISGPTTICNGASTTLTASGASTYQWTGGPATAAYNVSPTTNTTYNVTGTANGCSNTASQLVTVNALPVVLFSGLAASYQVTTLAASLTGSPVGGTFSGPGISGNTFTPSSAGVGGPYTITYFYTDGNGCSNSSSQQTSVTNCAVPAQPGTISVTGGAKACPGDTRTYKVTNVAGLTYNWITPTGGAIQSGQGTNQVVVLYNAGFTANGTMSVTANNGCGASTARTLAVTRNVPATPSVISGNINGVCHLTNQSYSVTTVANVTYSWSFTVATAVITSGQGTSAITADYNAGFASATLKVTANNACGASAVRSSTVKAAPATPGTITGTTTPCASQAGVPYSVATVAFATKYTWTAPTGSHVSDGVTTSSGTSLTTTSNSVTVNFGSTAGNVTVKAGNTCGFSSAKTLAVTFGCREVGGIEVPNNETLLLIPNPFSQSATLVIPETVDLKNSEIIIYDLLGKEQKRISNIKEYSVLIERGRLLPGAYVLLLKTNGENKFTERLLVQ